ncbi:DNA-directed RNA polymerase III subunit RPC3 [Aplysia californica]|uniref:DNA-directed RNA polymerase III subunit RPC3 n=1 Tax=Aplysia californica TaxID=6500 RepID=A0ABM0JBQ3_APLCA|nr:DNA-directed RNA polymerase III subunit RPC3 [Aplysia californica]
MSRVHLELCELLLKEYYGEQVAQVGTFLLKNIGSTLNSITQRTSLETKQVKSILCALVQQNIVRFRPLKPGITGYEASPDSVLWRLRFPSYIHCAKMLYGDAAELLVEELLLQGQSHLDTAVMKTTKKLNDSIVSSGASLPEISHNVIKEKVVTLVKARLIRRCEGVKKDENEKVVSLESHTDPNALFALPTAEDFRPATGSKRPQDAGPQGPAKRIKLESGAAVGTSDQEVPGTSSGPGYWCVNFHQFHHHFRDQAIIAAVSRNIDQRASEVMRTMLRLSETRTDPTFSESVHLSFTEVSIV